MSGIALVFHRDGAPAVASEVEAMTSAMSYRAVDGVHHELDGSIGIGFCSTATTPEAAREGQPLRHGRILVAMDGRLDDRAGLRAKLGSVAAPCAGDAELIALAVDRWGDRFVDHLIGDFAIVVADPVRRRVRCVRDHLGVRPLYYASCGPVFVAASEVRAVLAHPAVPAELDPQAFAAYAEHWIVPEGTIYRAIAPLPMGCALLATAEDVKPPARYWEPSCEPDERRTPEDVVEEYRWLVGEAIRDRLRSRGPIIVAMSGGLDSTSVASTALGLTRTDPGLAEVRVSSAVFPGHPVIDESPQIDVMERFLGVPVRRVRPRPRTPEEMSIEVQGYRELPDVPNDPFPSLVRPDQGERVLLTGLGGDDWFFNAPGLELAIAIRRGRLLSALRMARWGQAQGRYESTARSLASFGLRPLLRLPGTFAGRSPTLSRAAVRFGGRLGARLLRAGWCPPGVPLETAPLLSWSRDARLGSQFAAVQRRASRCGFEQRHPLHDIRLVELSLRLPGRLRTQDADPRWLPCQAMAGRLPDEIRLRREKAEFSLMVREELELAATEGVLTRAMAGPEARRARSDWQVIQGTAPELWHPRLASIWSLVAIQVAREGHLHAGAACRTPLC